MGATAVWANPSDAPVQRPPGVVSRLATTARVRSIVLLTLLAGAASWAVIQRLPESDADAAIVSSRHEIRSVAFDGNHLPMAALRDSLTTRAGDTLDHAKLDRDRIALQNVLAARGFLAATVDEGRVTFDADGGAFVSFAIAPGPLFHVRSIAVVGASETDAGVVTIGKGEVVLADRLAHARDAIAERLTIRGKPATVALEVVPDAAAAMADVVLVAR